jgi:hypothetical protein
VHRPWQEVDVQEGGLTPLLCGCLSLGPPSDWHIAPLLQRNSRMESRVHRKVQARFGEGCDTKSHE